MLGDGRTLEADAIVAGLGIEPNVELAARPACRSRTASSSTPSAALAAGRTCSPPAMSRASRWPRLAAELRVEHEDHAKSHGRRVGANMAGAAEPYDHLPFFYSDLFDLGYEAVGELDSRLDMLVRAGASSQTRGHDLLPRPRPPAAWLLLWNLFGQVDAARELIRAGEPVDAGALGTLGGESSAD